MDSKIKPYKDTFDCEKTSLTTPFSINDILTKENQEAKCNFENGPICRDTFGAKINFFSKGASGFGQECAFPKKEALDKEMKFYEDCGYRSMADDGALDMSRKNYYPVTELSG